VIRDPQGVKARLPKLKIRRPGAPGAVPEELCCSVVLEATDGVRLDLARELDGDLVIQATWSDSTGQAVRIVSADGKVRALQQGEVLQVLLSRSNNGNEGADGSDATVLVFRGELKVGDDLASLAERTLMSGTVRVVEASLIGRARYVVSEATLDPGDAIVWKAADQGKSVTVSGFVRASSAGESHEGLQVTAHAGADYIEVQRFGAAAYSLRPSKFERLTRDPVLSTVVALMAAIVAIATILDFGHRFLTIKVEPNDQ
jgi:hypothetical protein